VFKFKGIGFSNEQACLVYQICNFSVKKVADLKHGASILYIKELLGHGSLTTTEVYARVYPADFKKIIEAFHPRYSQGKRTMLLKTNFIRFPENSPAAVMPKNGCTQDRAFALEDIAFPKAREYNKSIKRPAMITIPVEYDDGKITFQGVIPKMKGKGKLLLEELPQGKARLDIKSFSFWKSQKEFGNDGVTLSEAVLEERDHS
jgi:hypothetical protein